MTPSRFQWFRLVLVVALLTVGPARGATRVDEPAKPGAGGAGPAAAAATESTSRGPVVTDVSAPTRVAMAEGVGHVLIDVKLDGRGPYRMILDTGAATTVIDADLVSELGLKSLGTTRIGDPSNPEANEVDVVKIDSVEVGGARFEGVDAVGWRGPSLTRAIGARGVLGLPTFHDCLLTIDYPKREVEVAPGELPVPDGKQVLELALNPIAEIPIAVAGRKASAHLDIGNASSLAVPGSWQSDLRTKGEVRKGAGMRASGPVEFAVATLDGDLTIGEQVFHDPEIRFDGKLDHANVGYGLLQGFAVTLDQRNGRVRLVGAPVTASAGQAPAEGRRRLGAMLGMTPDGFAEVRMVMPGSPAEAAGLRAGDTLIRVDGKPVTNDAMMTALSGTAPVVLGVRRGDKELELVVFGDAPPKG